MIRTTSRAISLENHMKKESRGPYASNDRAGKTRKALLEKRARNEVNAVLNAFSLCQKITQRSYDKICLSTDLGQAGRENI